MFRLKLTNYKGMLVTPDTAVALRSLEAQASEKGKWRVKYLKTDTTRPNPLSLAPAGREIRFVFERSGADAQTALNAAWGVAVPLGFTPWLRYPLVTEGCDVFHFFGLWGDVYDRLIAEGRGHLAWPSLCCAAQVDLGVWPGDKEEPRFVQAQLHRMGRNPGPLDGVVGPRTAACIESLGLPRGSFAQVAEFLRTAEPPEKKLDTKSADRGHLLVPGREVGVEAFGGVKAWRTPHGAAFEVGGPGRIVVDVR